MPEEIIEELPPALPVMVLPGVTLFPHALLPLFIFEPRYRAMLDDALGAGRMLVMAMPVGEGDEVKMVAGAGLVRACIRNPDGTSNLILQGVGRVRLTGWDQLEPYRIGRISPMDSISGSEGDGEVTREMELQVTRLHALCLRFKETGIELPSQFEAYLDQINNIGVMTDLVASTLVSDPAARQELLEELDVAKRLAGLLVHLTKQLF